MSPAQSPLAVHPPVAGPEPGDEPNLHLLDCLRCSEPMYHFFRLEAEYPLCFWWAFKCGECGHRVDAWEDKPVTASPVFDDDEPADDEPADDEPADDEPAA